jgi:hypothetical protein
MNYPILNIQIYIPNLFLSWCPFLIKKCKITSIHTKIHPEMKSITHLNAQQVRIFKDLIEIVLLIPLQKEKNQKPQHPYK